jgi:hypothetical protein
VRLEPRTAAVPHPAFVSRPIPSRALSPVRRERGTGNHLSDSQIRIPKGVSGGPRLPNLNKAGGRTVSEVDIVISRLPEKVCHNRAYPTCPASRRGARNTRYRVKGPPAILGLGPRALKVTMTPT